MTTAAAHAEPKAVTLPRPKGIACPCGGRTRVTHIRQPSPGLVVRYRCCLVCRAKLVTRETAR